MRENRYPLREPTSVVTARCVKNQKDPRTCRLLSIEPAVYERK